jgi:predicted permease
MRPRDVKRLFRFTFRDRDDVRGDIHEEFALHLELRTRDLVNEGLTPRDARAQAEREFGHYANSVAAISRNDEHTESRRRVRRYLDDLRQDLTLAVRLLVRAPGFAAVAILTLALGIGANTAIYSVLDAILLHPTPYPEPERLVQIWETREDGGPNSPSGGAFLDWRQHQTQFAAIVLTGRVAYNLRGRDGSERIRGVEASHELLAVLGITPALGRGFMPDDDRPGGNNNVVLITDELWRSRFAADPTIVGRDIILDEVPRTVIGVLPRGAWILKEDLFFVPAVLTPGTPRAARSPHWAAVFGRLAPDTSVERADAELKSIRQQLAPEYPAFKARWGVRVQPISEFIGGLTRGPLLILAGAVSLVLLIACANVANLLLARACHRQQELAIRSALGAGGARLVRQMLTESLVLALLGGLCGVGLAIGSLAALRTLTSELLPLTTSPQLNLRVLAFSLAITVGTGLLFGLLPALGVRRFALARTLGSAGRSLTPGGRQRTLSGLVVAEIALTVVLLASAGLLLRSFSKVVTIDPGFDPERVLAFDVSLPAASYDSDAKRLVFVSTLLDRLRAVPGVESAGAGMAIPFSIGAYGERFERPGRPDPEKRPIGRVNFVAPGYLETIGARLLSGRLLIDADNRVGTARMAVINQSTARRFFANDEAIGQSLTIAGDAWQIVGVVADVADRQLDAVPGAYAWIPQAFNTSRMAIVIRTPVNPLTLVAAARAEMQRIDPGVAMANPRRLDQSLAESMLQRKVVLSLVGGFALAALALACLGVYGVMAYVVVTRQKELGIRMALGAVRGDVLRDVFRRGLTIAAVGVGIGLAGAFAAGRLLAGELYQVGRVDPAVTLGTAAVMTCVAALACWLPARRASRVDPVTILRSE